MRDSQRISIFQSGKGGGECGNGCQLPRKGAPSGRAASFELVDMFGKVMLKEELEAKKNIYSINVKELPGGMYVLRIVTDSKMYRQKVVVMR